MHRPSSSTSACLSRCPTHTRSRSRRRNSARRSVPPTVGVERTPASASNAQTMQPERVEAIRCRCGCHDAREPTTVLASRRRTHQKSERPLQLQPRHRRRRHAGSGGWLKSGVAVSREAIPRRRPRISSASVRRVRGLRNDVGGARWNPPGSGDISATARRSASDSGRAASSEFSAVSTCSGVNVFNASRFGIWASSRCGSRRSAGDRQPRRWALSGGQARRQSTWRRVQHA